MLLHTCAKGQNAHVLVLFYKSRHVEISTSFLSSNALACLFGIPFERALQLSNEAC